MISATLELPTSSYVGGQWQKAAGTALPVMNPSTSETSGTLASAAVEEVAREFATAKHAQVGWAALPAVRRGDLLGAMADVLAVNRALLEHSGQRGRQVGGPGARRGRLCGGRSALQRQPNVQPWAAEQRGFIVSTVLGKGDYTYRVEEGSATWPEGWTLGDLASVSVDNNDNVYVFHRGDHPMIVFAPLGNVIDSWGDGVFSRPHGVFIAPDQMILCTDDGDRSVRQCTLDGKVLLTLGAPATASPYQSDPGQFNLPHNLCSDAEGRVYVADRENHRIQVFVGAGNYQEQWNNLHRPSGLYVTPGPDPIFYVGELGPYLRSNFGWPNIGAQGSASCPPRARCWPVWTLSPAPGRNPAGSSPRTASPWIPRETSMSARSP